MFRVSLFVVIFCLLCGQLIVVISKQIPDVTPSDLDGIKSDYVEGIGSNHLERFNDVEEDEVEANKDIEAILKKTLRDMESLLSTMTRSLQEDDHGNRKSIRRRKREVATMPPLTAGTRCGEDESYNFFHSAGYPILFPCGFGFPRGPFVPQNRQNGCPSPADQGNSGTNDHSTFATTYVRWGRSDCPETAEMVYDGIMGGSWSQETGNGANYLCLPRTPSFSSVISGSQSQRAHIRSIELHSPSNFPPFDHIGSGEIHEMTCAVCRVTSRSTSLMVPATTVCPTVGWTLEYSGFLVSEVHHRETRTEYVCVDGEPQGFPGTSDDSLGGNLALVESVCTPGGLPCGPYVNGYELSCVVCTM